MRCTSTAVKCAVYETIRHYMLAAACNYVNAAAMSIVDVIQTKCRKPEN